MNSHSMLLTSAMLIIHANTERQRRVSEFFFSFIGKSGLHRYIDHNKNIDHEPESESQMDQQ